MCCINAKRKKLRILFCHFFFVLLLLSHFLLIFLYFFSTSFFLSSSFHPFIYYLFFLFWNKLFEQLIALFLLFCNGSHCCVFGVWGVPGNLVALLLPLPLFLQVSINFHVSLILGIYKKKFMWPSTANDNNKLVAHCHCCFSFSKKKKENKKKKRKRKD